jgi:hypothetical protein
MISHSSEFRCFGKPFSHLFAQRFEIGGGGAAGVDQEVGVLLDICARPARAAHPGVVDQLPGLQVVGVVGRPVEENPAGLRKVDPAVRSLVGWVASRLASCSAIRAASAAGSPGAPSKRRLGDHPAVGQAV